MTSTQVSNNLLQSTWPSCMILPSSSGSTTNCIQMPMPSMGSMIGVLIISWIIFMIVAYLIYHFLNWTNPHIRYNYWMILLVLIVAGIVVALLSKLF